jgi:hypothetical protein
MTITTQRISLISLVFEIVCSYSAIQKIEKAPKRVAAQTQKVADQSNLSKWANPPASHSYLHCHRDKNSSGMVIPIIL